MKYISKRNSNECIRYKESAAWNASYDSGNWRGKLVIGQIMQSQIMLSSYRHMFCGRFCMQDTFMKEMNIQWLVILHCFLWINDNFLMTPFHFLLPIRRESIVFGSNFRNGDFDGFTCFEVPWIQKSFSVFGLCVCVSVISITQKQITAETPNLVLYIDATRNFS